MEMKPVKSSGIQSVGFDPVKRIMHVRFHSGRSYEYLDVGEKDHAALITAKSLGKHFAAHFANRKAKRLPQG